MPLYAFLHSAKLIISKSPFLSTFWLLKSRPWRFKSGIFTKSAVFWRNISRTTPKGSKLSSTTGFSVDSCDPHPATSQIAFGTGSLNICVYLFFDSFHCKMTLLAPTHNPKKSGRRVVSWVAISSSRF